MPLYEYSCDKCEIITTARQKFSDEPLTTCDCGGSLSKTVSQTSFKLNGNYWYKDGYSGVERKKG